MTTTDAYPTKPKGWSLGRVLRVDGENVHIRHGWPKSKVLRVRVARVALKPGDVVAFPPKEKAGVREVRLLARSRGEQPATRASVETLRQWSRFQLLVREFFVDRDFVDAQTPTLVACPGTEPFLEVFRTKFEMGRRRENLFLPTSPELHLKKALALGFERVFEIKSCFRNGEISPHHQPEFLMLEWYRAGEDLEAIRGDLERLIRSTCAALKITKVSSKKFRRVTVADLFKKHVGFTLTPTTTLADLQTLARKLGLNSEGHDWDDLFGLIFVDRIEAKIDAREPLFVESYPPSQAAYARIGKDGWAERFELYWKGLEIANAFHELNDPRVQKARMREDLSKKKQVGRKSIKLDQEFFRALESGMPPSSGIAVGLERLFLAATGLKDLAEVRLFPMK